MASDNTTEEKQSGKQDKIKIPLLLPLTLVILALLGAAIVSIYRLQQQHINNQTQMRIDKTQYMFQMELDEDAELLNGLVDFLEHDENIQNAWLVKDRDALLQCTMPVFKEICSKYRVTHFYFIDMDRVCFLRVHNPPRHGDYIDRFTMDHAVRQKKPTHGIELGPYGTFTLRVVRPWKIDGEPVGYIELGQEIEHIIPELRKVTGSKIFSVIEKSYLNRAKWEEGMRMIGHDRDWDQFEQFVVISSTKEEIPPNLNKIMERHHAKHGKFFFDLSIGGRHFHNGLVPLFDAGGREVGEIVVMNDVTEKEASLRTSAAVLTTICVVIGGLLFTFFYFFIGRIERRIIKGRNDLTDEINERKKAEEQMLKTQAQLKSVLQTIPSGLFTVDLNRTVTSWNRMAESISGLKMEDVIGKKCTEIWNCPTCLEKCGLYSNDVEKPIFSKECQITLPDGKQFLASRNLTYLLGEEGKIIGGIESFTDITDRTKAEDALQESEEKLRLMSAHMYDYIMMLDLEFNIQFVNRAGQGLKIDQLVGKPPYIHVDKDEQSRIRKKLKKVVETGEPSFYETEYHRPDGSIIYFESIASPIFDEDKITGIVVSSRDITERKKAEEALRESETMNRSLLEGSPVCNKIIDLDFKLRYMSAAGLKQLKIPDIKPYYGQTYPPKFYPESMRAPLIKNLKLAMAGEITTVEAPVHDIEGNELWYHTTFVPALDDDGRVKYVIGSSVDITERKQAEEVLERVNEDLESAVRELNRSNKDLQDFAHVTAHDLKSPLRAIGALANWISTDYADKFDEDGREQMELLMDRVKRMHNLIEAILQYSRVGREKERHVQVNLNELVPTIIDMVAPPRNITITTENQLPVIECEETRIIQIFQNLLSNAVKYLDKPQGQIRIGCVEEDGFWKFSVADNGPGIEERYFEKIFEIFQTLSPRDDSENTGVGLTTIKKIVELYDGKIWVESKVGEGSTFFFTLPKQEQEITDAKLAANIFG
jgi:PAS domain S-box-containing protein